MITKHEYVMKLVNKPTAWMGHGMFAINLVEKLKPEVVVDLGVDYGFSTFCFAYHNIGKVYGIDWFQGDEQAGYRNTLADVIGMYDQLKIAHGINNIEFIQSDFTEASKKWDKKIDILHIDGLHTYEAIKNDFDCWIDYLTPEGVVLFHDVESYPDTVGVFFNQLNDGHELLKSGSAGLGIYTKSEMTMKKIQKII